MAERFVYEPGQVRAIFPYVERLKPKWFVIGGPADGSEAQELHSEFPGIQVVGFEPNAAFHYHQLREAGFPGMLIKAALWRCPGTMPLSLMGEGHGRSSRIVERDPDAPSYPVQVVTLDSALQGTTEGTIALWIDIERAELDALRGARNLFISGRVVLVYLEAFTENFPAIEEYLNHYGLELREKVNAHEEVDDAGTLRLNRFDAIFTKEPSHEGP